MPGPGDQRAATASADRASRRRYDRLVPGAMRRRHRPAKTSSTPSPPETGHFAAVELDPLYVGVILRRFEAATGSATLAETGEAFEGWRRDEWRTVAAG